ncbi:MAG TPA: stage II sporulation protein R [Clostridiales bacterium]|nr:stage II sporulation protein R [Clostridiales bacterium]
MKKRFLFLIILFTLYIFVNFYCYASNILNNIEDKVFRLHIIANSNSKEDQALKYKVRDNIISYMNEICKNASSKEDVIKLTQKHIGDFKKIADYTIIENGFNYTSTVEIGNYEFPTKKYGDISFPCGCYDALEIKLGKNSGQNWWCVLYPSLCFIDVSSGILPESSKEELKNILPSEEYALISENTPTYNFKFKLVELFSSSFILGKNEVES